MADLPVAEQFDDARQQRESITLGMWTFLATEVLFFGVLFTAYTIYRHLHPAAFAEAGRHLYAWIGTVNTALLLLSSWSMALAVEASTRGDGATRRYLLRTVALGGVFLLFKALEYWLDVRERLWPGAAFAAERFEDAPHARMFFVLYFIMTGLHALHILIGLGVMATYYVRAKNKEATRRSSAAIEMCGLYWHFVDVVWIFLFPLLYLAA